MCWQGYRLSEYIQGVNELVEYTQKFTLSLSVWVSDCYMLWRSKQSCILQCVILKPFPGIRNRLITLWLYTFAKILIHHLTSELGELITK